MDDNQLNILKARLTRTEGRRNRPYIDTVGKVTIGIGHNLTDKGISDELVDQWLVSDITEAEVGVLTLPCYPKLDPIRQTVLLDMCFNMGIEKVKEFVNTLSFLSQGRYEYAAEQLLASKWAAQVGSRAVELARIIKDGHV